MVLIRNPNAGKFVSPTGYTDLGWQLWGDHPNLKQCRESNHKTHEFDNSQYMNRCTDVITICDECKTVHHIDMSD